VSLEGRLCRSLEPRHAHGGRERVGGEFDRTLTLPAQIDAAKVTADYRDGVLTLKLPRAESERPRSVTIN